MLSPDLGFHTLVGQSDRLLQSLQVTLNMNISCVPTMSNVHMCIYVQQLFQSKVRVWTCVGDTVHISVS